MIPIIFDYSIQHKHIEKIIKRHWCILLADGHLQDILPDLPKFIYRSAPTICDIEKRIPDPSGRGLTFCTGKEFYPCKRCLAWVKTKRPNEKKINFTSTSTGNIYEINELICCNIEGAAYALECSCGLQYIGRTKSPLKICIREHVQNILKGFDKHSVSKHFVICHNKDPTQLKFWGIEPFVRHWQGSHKVRTLSQLESKWIFTLDTFAPRGLNVEFDLNSFISNF